MRKTYKGVYKLKNPDKYVGDPSNVIYRSLWERSALKWLDENPKIEKFSSEEIVVPYYDESTNRVRRYFTDLWFTTTDQSIYLIEIKPEKECSPPKKGKRSTAKYLAEAATYIKNQSKWKAADKYAKERGWTFQVWTEKTLRSLGIRIVGK